MYFHSRKLLNHCLEIPKIQTIELVYDDIHKLVTKESHGE